MADREQPLAGCRVLDFSWVWSGPAVGAALAELGAEVIKVEHGQRLDNSRLRGRPLRDGRPVPGPAIELTPYFHQTNHGKRSITVNVKDPRAVDLLHRLVAVSDVVLENLTPGVMSRNGLGYADLARIRPDIVMLSMSAAGQDGPLMEMRAYAPIMSGLCGLEGLVGYPGESPIGMLNFGYGDPNAAVHGVLVLLVALYHRDRTGQGQHIDMSQMEALLAVMTEPLMDYFLNGRVQRPRGHEHPSMAPHGIFPAAGVDRWLSIAVKEESEWSALTEVMGGPDWARRPEFADRYARLRHRREIEADLGRWTRTQERDDLVRRLRAAGVAASPVLSIEEQREDERLRSRGILCRVVHPLLGEEALYRLPWQLGATPPRIDASAPLLGADNAYVFGDLLGLGTDEINRLEAQGVIA